MYTLPPMPTQRDDLIHLAIHRTLAYRSGDAASAFAFAAAVVDIWRRISEQLEPVIGKRGFNILFERSIQLASKTHQWLGLVEANEAMGVSLTDMTDMLAAQDAPVAHEASCAVLTSFTDLLANLIGASLADRLLHAVWTPEAGATELETKP